MAGSTITGIEQLRKQLELLDKKIQGQVIRKALRDGAKVIAAAVKARAPVESGRTKRSVKVRAGKRRKDVISASVVVTGGHDEPFIGFVELGTKNQPPNPFMRGAFAAKEGEVRADALEQIKRAIEESGR